MDEYESPLAHLLAYELPWFAKRKTTTHKTTMYLVSPLDEEAVELEDVAAAAADVELAEAAATFCVTEELVTWAADEERVEVNSPPRLVGAARTDEEVASMDEYAGLSALAVSGPEPRAIQAARAEDRIATRARNCLGANIFFFGWAENKRMRLWAASSLRLANE